MFIRDRASRARAKVNQPRLEDRLADWEVVDAFMAAAKNGDFDRLLRLLAPDAAVTADDAAVLIGTPAQIQGRDLSLINISRTHETVQDLLCRVLLAKKDHKNY